MNLSIFLVFDLLHVGWKLAHGLRIREHGAGGVLQEAQVPHPKQAHKHRQVGRQRRGREMAVHASRAF